MKNYSKELAIGARACVGDLVIAKFDKKINKFTGLTEKEFNNVVRIFRKRELNVLIDDYEYYLSI